MDTTNTYLAETQQPDLRSIFAGTYRQTDIRQTRKHRQVFTLLSASSSRPLFASLLFVLFLKPARRPPQTPCLALNAARSK